MNSLEEYVYRSFEVTLSKWPSELTNNIYALSLYLANENDDPRYCTVTLGYNTYAQWQASTPQKPDHLANRWPIASDSDEAKWNYAFWLQNSELVIATSERPDDIAIALRNEWLKGLKLWYDNQELQADFDAAMTKAAEIDRQFAELCVRIAYRLHTEGIMQRIFGRNIPILVHRLEYYDEIATYARNANPPGIAQEFEDWIAAMYSTDEYE